jgi:multidrug resistance efflux pump
MNANRRGVCSFPYLFGLLGLAALTASVAAAGWAFTGLGAGRSSAGAPAAEGAGVVCLGQVDVEPGVARLGSEQSGRVVQVLVQDGQEVAAGAALVQLDDWHPRSRLRQAAEAVRREQARREQAQVLVRLREAEQRLQQTALEGADVRLATARRRLAELEGPFRDKVSRGDVKDLKDTVHTLEVARRAEEEKLQPLALQVEADRQALEQGRAAAAAAEEQLRQAQRQVDDCLLKAPFKGQVLRVRARPGELVGPAFPEPLVELCPDRPRVVRAEVSQEFARRVGLGAACRLGDDVDATGPSWRGRVVRLSDWYTQRRSILHEPLQVNDVRTLECLIEVDPGQPPLRIGQRLRVLIGPALAE